MPWFVLCGRDGRDGFGDLRDYRDGVVCELSMLVHYFINSGEVGGDTLTSRKAQKCAASGCARYWSSSYNRGTGSCGSWIMVTVFRYS